MSKALAQRSAAALHWYSLKGLPAKKTLWQGRGRTRPCQFGAAPL